MSFIPYDQNRTTEAFGTFDPDSPIDRKALERFEFVTDFGSLSKTHLVYDSGRYSQHSDRRWVTRDHGRMIATICRGASYAIIYHPDSCTHLVDYLQSCIIRYFSEERIQLLRQSPTDARQTSLEDRIYALEQLLGQRPKVVPSYSDQIQSLERRVSALVEQLRPQVADVPSGAVPQKPVQVTPYQDLEPGTYWVWFDNGWRRGEWDGEDWEVNGSQNSFHIPVGPKWTVPTKPTELPTP